MNRILELRKEKHLSQEFLAKYVGSTRSAISFYENGQRKIPTNIAVKLAEFFDVSTDYLLGNSNTRNLLEDDKLKIGLSTKDYTFISEEQKRQIEEFARFVLRDNLKKKDK